MAFSSLTGISVGKLQKFKIIYCSLNKNVIPSQGIIREHNIYFSSAIFKRNNMMINFGLQPF
jgi:hypothetical protein